MEGVSVILCCHNSASRLFSTLKCLANQRLTESIKWEVVLIDNNSKDDTSRKAHDIWRDLGSPVCLRIVEEPVLGLSNARRRGVLESNFDVLVFCDDDNWLAPEYVKEALDSMNEMPKAGAIGAYGRPVCEGEPPDWFVEYADHFATGPQGSIDDSMQDVTLSRGYIYGAGAVFRKASLLELFSDNFMPIVSDRVGNTLISGGDNELCYGLRLLNYRIYFNPELRFTHYIPRVRLSEDYLRRLNFGFGYSYQMLLPYKYKLEGRSMEGVKIHWIWFMMVGVGQFIINDVPEILFRNGLRRLRFRVNFSGRKGALTSIWLNRKQLSKNFYSINDRFKSYGQA